MQRILLNGRTIKSSISMLEKSERALANWPLDGPRTAFFADIKRLYRKSRKAMRLARAEPTDKSLHEACKQVKYLALALEMLKGHGNRHLKKARERADDIEGLLGEDHDLSLLQSKLMTLSTPNLGKELSPKIRGQRKKLQFKAFHIGKCLDREKAGTFVTSLCLF